MSTESSTNETDSSDKKSGKKHTNGHAAFKNGGDLIETQDILFSKIRLPKGFNIRGDEMDDEGLDELGESIKTSGLINPLVVEPDTDGEHFLLRAGFRRHAAMKKAGIHRGTVRCTVRHFKDAADAALVNAGENLRLNPKTADVAKRLYEFNSGTYPGAPTSEEGEPLAPIERKLVCEKLGLSYPYAGALIKAWDSACEKVRVAWKKKDVPTDVVREICKAKEAEEQEALLAKWESGDKKRKKKVKEAKAKVSGGGSSEDDAEDGAPGRKTIRETLASWREKLDDPETGKALITGKARVVAEAQIDTLRWVYGDIKRVSFAKA